MATKRGNGQGTLYKRDGRGLWTMQYIDCNGRRLKQTTGTVDKAAALRILNKRLADTALRREGVVDVQAESIASEGRRPIRDHVADFRADLHAKGVSKKTTDLTTGRVMAIIDRLHAERIDDLSPSRVQGAIGDIRDEGRSLQTCLHYLRAVKQLSRWLVRDGRAIVDALAHLKGPNVATDRRHDRRALTDAEIDALMDAAESGEDWTWRTSRKADARTLRLTGPARVALYRLALGTGFRVGELRSLTPASFELDGEPPAVTVEAAYSKRRRRDVQPIRRDLAETMRPWLNGARDEPVFPMPDKLAVMMRADLDAAGIPYHDDSGRVADFHSLRHSYITRLIQSGASVKAAQTLARHSTPALTIGRYAHVQLHDLSAALDGLPASAKRTAEAGATMGATQGATAARIGAA
ncbi:MAG: tyrosine-type recombinase/integrase [Phycisphaerales bacterium]|nr:tyrosine-type recombinase/integrase [Phycisphaerales bacterium]